jgi:hypothetical protein
MNFFTLPHFTITGLKERAAKGENPIMLAAEEYSEVATLFAPVKKDLDKAPHETWDMFWDRKKFEQDNAILTVNGVPIMIKDNDNDQTD